MSLYGRDPRMPPSLTPWFSGSGSFLGGMGGVSDYDSRTQEFYDITTTPWS